jgi:hypothetical protein
VALIDEITAHGHTPTLEAYIGGRRVTPLTSVVELGYDIGSAAATVELASVPSWINFRQAVEVRMGYGGFSIPTFVGETEDDARAYFPLTNEVKAAGYLKRAHYQNHTAASYSSLTDTAIVDDLLSDAGITNRNIAGDGTTLGTVAPLVLGAGRPFMDLIESIDQVFRYKTFDSAGGVVRRLISGIPANSPAFTYTKGDTSYPILSIARPRTVRGIHNKIIITGHPSAAVDTVRVADNPYVPNPPKYIALDFASDVIQTAAIATTCSTRLMQEFNRIHDEIRLTVPGNPYLQPGMTISITHSDVGLTTATPYFLKHVTHRINASGYTCDLVLEGGAGEAGYELGKAPIAMFSMIVTRERYDIAGVATTMYTVMCDGSASWDPDSLPSTLTFSWVNNKNADVSTAVRYSTAFTQAEMDNATKPTITLTVDDADATSGSGVLTQTVDIGTAEIINRQLYVAALERAEASPDGGVNWNTFTPGVGIGVISTPEIAALTYGLFGCDNGRLYKTTDNLVTAPTLLITFGSAVNAIWVNEIDANRVFVGLASGELQRSDDAGVTWTLVYTHVAAIQWVVEAFDGPIRVCVGAQVLVSTDGGLSWSEVINFGSGTAKRLAHSFFASYGSANAAGGTTDPVKRFDGVAIVGASGTTAVLGLTHHIRDDILYAGGTGGLTYIKAAGNTTFTTGGTLPGLPGSINHMIRDGDYERILYAAAGAGLYKTFSNAATWARMRDYSSPGLNGLMVGYGAAPLQQVTATNIISATAVTKILSLGTATGTAGDPANWRDATFNDTTWALAVRGTTSLGQLPASDSEPVWSATAPSSPAETILVRQKFTLAAGVISAAQLLTRYDAFIRGTTDNLGLGYWINNTFLPTVATGAGIETSHTVDPTILRSGSSDNTIAVKINAGKVSTAQVTWLSYKLTVS